jgi:hypothetical protein
MLGRSTKVVFVDKAAHGSPLKWYGIAKAAEVNVLSVLELFLLEMFSSALLGHHIILGDGAIRVEILLGPKPRSNDKALFDDASTVQCLMVSLSCLITRTILRVDSRSVWRLSMLMCSPAELTSCIIALRAVACDFSFAVPVIDIVRARKGHAGDAFRREAL